MSEGRSVGVGGGTPLRELERRLALAASDRPPSLQDQRDFAEALIAEGAAREGELLLASAAIQSGVCADAADLLRRPEAAPVQRGRSASTVELAITEVRALAAEVGGSIASRVARGPVQAVFSPSLHPTAIPVRAPRSASGGPFDLILHEISRWLKAPGGGDDRQGADLLESLRGAPGPVEPVASWASAAPVGLLAELIALISLRRFLQLATFSGQSWELFGDLIQG